MLRRAFFHTPLLAAAFKQGLPRTFEAGILRMMEVGPVPGLVAGVLREGQPGWVRALGVRGIETKEPMQPDTLFQAASLSKQIAAYAAFALRDAGKLDFDQPLVSYVDDLEDARARTVTTRHVLSHSAGFPNWRFEAGQKLVPDFAPGTKFQYSGEGYFYLQRVMEQVSGQSYCDLVDALVFQPLKMDSTCAMWRPDWSSRYALPHDRRGVPRANWDRRARSLYENGSSPRAWKYAEHASAARAAGVSTLPDSLLPNAAASMVTTVPDYARFISAALKNREIGREQVKMRPSLGWGLGWGIERFAGREYLWQWGDNGGFKNFVAAEPATGNAVFVFTNGDAGARVYDRIVTGVTGHDHPAMFWL